MRNRTMALISDATLIIEASEKSGTKHQGWEALQLGRELYINEDLINNNISWAKEMLKYGAQIINIENANSLLQALPIWQQKNIMSFNYLTILVYNAWGQSIEAQKNREFIVEHARMVLLILAVDLLLQY